MGRAMHEILVQERPQDDEPPMSVNEHGVDESIGSFSLLSAPHGFDKGGWREVISPSPNDLSTYHWFDLAPDEIGALERPDRDGNVGEAEIRVREQLAIGIEDCRCDHTVRSQKCLKVGISQDGRNVVGRSRLGSDLKLSSKHCLGRGYREPRPPKVLLRVFGPLFDDWVMRRGERFGPNWGRFRGRKLCSAGVSQAAVRSRRRHNQKATTT